MVIKIINDKETWDVFVDKSKYGLLFHKWNFLKIVEKHSSFKLYTYGIYKENELISIFPFFYYKKYLLKMIFSPPPKSAIPHLGFIVNNEFDVLKQNKKEDYLKSIVIDIDNEIKKISPNYINFTLVPNFFDIRQFKWNGYKTDPRFTYIIELTNPIEKIWEDFKQETRKGINKANKIGFKLKCEDDVSIFYEKLRERYEEQKMKEPLFGKKYIEDLIDQFKDNIKLYYLYNNKDEIMSCVLTQQYKDRFVYWLGSTKSDNYANEYLLWSLIQLAKSENYSKFDFTGANTENICRFKSKFNPHIDLYFSLYKKGYLSGFMEFVYENLINKNIF